MGRSLRIVRLAAAAVVAAGASAGAAAQDWTLVDIGTLGGPGSYGAAVSDDGFVTGCADVSATQAHAFVYRNGAMRDLGAGADGAAGGSSCGLAVNDAGVVAGRASSGELVVWEGGGVSHLGVNGTVGGINDAGTIVGAFDRGGSTRAFVYRNGTFTALGTLDDSSPGASSAAAAINARGDVVGSSNGHAFLYDAGSLVDLGTLGGAVSGARDINDRGDIVGMSTNAQGEPTPFIVQGTMRALPGPSSSGAVGIDDGGLVVGSGEGIYGYVIEGGTATRLDLLPSVAAKGWRHLEPTGVNDRGWIVGTAVDAQGDLRAFLLVPGVGATKGAATTVRALVPQ